MISIRKYIKLASFLFIASFNALSGVHGHLTNDVFDMASSKKIWLKINLDAYDQGIFKQAICFSLDNPAIQLISWHPSLQPGSVYCPAFKKSKKMFLKPFVINLAFKAQGDNEQLRQLLENTNLYISGLAAEKDGSIKPFMLMLPLTKVRMMQKQQTQPMVPLELVSPIKTEPQPWIEVPSLAHEYDLLDRLGVLWRRLCTYLSQHLSWWLLLKIFMFLFCVFALIIVKSRYRWLSRIIPLHGAWEREIKRLVIFLMLSSVFYFLSFFIKTYYLLYVFAALCFMGMCYAYLFVTTTTFLMRIKSLIGFLLGASVLPLLMKAYLLKIGF